MFSVALGVRVLNFVLTALNSHGNLYVCSDLVELKIKRDLPEVEV